MIEPDIHPHAEDTAQFLREAFGPRAPQALLALKKAAGDAELMRVLEAFGFAHETTEDPNVNTMLMREGMRRMVLTIQSARSIPESMFNTSKEALT